MNDVQTDESKPTDGMLPERKGWRTWRWDGIAYVALTAIPGAFSFLMAMLMGVVLLSGNHVAGAAWIAPAALLGLSAFAAVTLRPKTGIPTPQDRIEEVVGHLEATGRLLRDLEDDLGTRTKVLQQLQEDAERYEKLIDLNTDQAKAIDDMVGRQLKQQAKEARWLWVGSLILAVVFGFFIEWLSDPVLRWFTN